MDRNIVTCIGTTHTEIVLHAAEVDRYHAGCTFRQCTIFVDARGLPAVEHGEGGLVTPRMNVIHTSLIKGATDDAAGVRLVEL